MKHFSKLKRARRVTLTIEQSTGEILEVTQVELQYEYRFLQLKMGRSTQIVTSTPTEDDLLQIVEKVQINYTFVLRDGCLTATS